MLERALEAAHPPHAPKAPSIELSNKGAENGPTKVLGKDDRGEASGVVYGEGVAGGRPGCDGGVVGVGEDVAEYFGEGFGSIMTIFLGFFVGYYFMV